MYNVQRTLEGLLHLISYAEWLMYDESQVFKQMTLCMYQKQCERDGAWHFVQNKYPLNGSF